MIHCAEKLLKATNIALGDYASAHRANASFWRDIEKLKRLSLQKLSLQSDAEFFDKINTVLSVITTIIIHPHILNARQTVIVRAEQAHGLTPEMFMDTVRDQKLWKDKRGQMTPEEVYYFENIDELKNYENRFIVHLLDKINDQLNEYGKFYDYMLGRLNQGGVLTKDNSQLEKLMRRLDSLAKKVRRIKGTYFYKEVSKANTSFTHIEATNVLKHNRAYNFCYRFYTAYITYSDEQAVASDLANYYFTRLLLALLSCGFELQPSPGEKHYGVIRPMRFESQDFALGLEPAGEYDGFWVNVTNKKLGGELGWRNLLVFDGSVDFETVQRNLLSYPAGAHTAVDAINVWDSAYVDGGVRPLDAGRLTEVAILKRYIKDKTKTVKGSPGIYSKHCPVCGGKDIGLLGDNEFSCNRCGSVYSFQEDNIWFKKLRKI